MMYTARFSFDGVKFAVFTPDGVFYADGPTFDEAFDNFYGLLPAGAKVVFG